MIYSCGLFILHIVVCTSWFPSPFLPLSFSFSPLVTISLFSIPVSLLFCYIRRFVASFRFHLEMLSEYLSFMSFRALLSIMPSKSIHVAANGESSSFLWLNSISLYIYTHIDIQNASLSIHLLMDT